MTRRSWIALAALSASAFVACREYLPQNRYMQVRKSPNTTAVDVGRKFDHAGHGDALAMAGVDCIDCHRFDAVVDVEEPIRANRAEVEALRPGSTACHFCHVDVETRSADAPSACVTCHDSVLALRPLDHDLAWSRRHAQASRVDPTSCASCHQQTECIDCHQRRDTIQTLVHERNFLQYHAVQARANPIQCGSCHRVDFCSSCHARGAAEPGSVP